jgi:hypothetical protein
MNTQGHKALLLNASSIDLVEARWVVYPYAFIQVPAVARRAGVEVICKDLLGVPQERWEQTGEALIEQHHPAMVLITLRNTDSMVSQDYRRDALERTGRRAYFPIERTKELIAAIRAVSDLRIAVGGFGFSLLADELMHYLRPDFGVFGGPDAFFSHFEDLLDGNPGEVANLLYFQEDRLISNPRILNPPLAATEYTPQAIEEMMAFYDSFPPPEFLGAPVEIMRGCCNACRWCTEPHVVGRKVRYRDLSTVMADIDMLADHGITRIDMISSELNPEGNGFALELAGRIRLFNERQPDDRKVTWSAATCLMNFSLEEYELLNRSGFIGGGFDIAVLDDENARAMRTPYRGEALLTHLKACAQFQKARADLLQAHEVSHPEAMDGLDSDNREGRGAIWGLFLGNPATTTETVRNTLRVANQEGLAQLFDGCHITTNFRVFDYQEPNEAALAVTYSVTADLERISYRQLLPSFAYPPALLRDFGSAEEVELMFRHIARTYLSTRYVNSRDWYGFVRQKTTAGSITRWMAELSDTHGVRVPDHLRPTVRGGAAPALRRLFAEDPRGEERHTSQSLAKQAVDSLLSACLEAFPGPFGPLGLPTTMDELDRMTPYELAVAIFSRRRTENELVDELAEQTSALSEPMKEVSRFCVEAMLHWHNALIRPKYRDLFVPAGGTDSERR